MALLLSVKACAIESHRPEDSTTTAQRIQYQAQLHVQITQLLCNPPTLSLLPVLKFHLDSPSKCFYFTPSCQEYCGKKCVHDYRIFDTSRTVSARAAESCLFPVYLQVNMSEM